MSDSILPFLEDLEQWLQRNLQNPNLSDLLRSMSTWLRPNRQDYWEFCRWELGASAGLGILERLYDQIDRLDLDDGERDMVKQTLSHGLWLLHKAIDSSPGGWIGPPDWKIPQPTEGENDVAHLRDKLAQLSD